MLALRALDDERLALAKRERLFSMDRERPSLARGPFENQFPATTYSPTQLPVQYHRR